MFELLNKVRRDPDMWLNQTEKNLDNDVYKTPMEYEWIDKDKNVWKFLATGGKRQNYANGCILEKICYECNLLKDYAFRATEIGRTSHLKKAKEIWLQYSNFLHYHKCVFNKSKNEWNGALSRHQYYQRTLNVKE